MRKSQVFVSFLITLAIVVMSVSTAMAAGPSGSWSSGIACQNLDTQNKSTVTLTFYREGQSTKAISYGDDGTLTIDPGKSRNWLTTSSVSMPSFPTSFTGSAVISSSTQLACNLNTQSTGNGTKTNPYRMGTASGFNDQQSSAVMYVPQAIKGAAGYNSYISVQNTSTAAVGVHVNYYLPDGTLLSNATETATIQGQSNKVFYQSDNANLPAGFNGGARITSDDNTTKLAVVVALYKGGADFTQAQFASYNGASAGTQIVYVPRVVRKLVGNNSGIAIQNVGSAATNISVQFSFGGQTFNKSCSNNPVGKFASCLIYLPTAAELLPVDAMPPAAHQGSAVITADTGGQIIATVNEDNNDATSGTRQGNSATYNAINKGQETSTIFFAQFTKTVTGVLSSGFQVSDASPTHAGGTCNIEYSGDTTLNESNVTLPPNGSIVRWALSSVDASMISMKSGYNAAVKVSCTVPVTGIVNLSAYGTQAWGDSFTQTTGLNQ